MAKFKRKILNLSTDRVLESFNIHVLLSYVFCYFPVHNDVYTLVDEQWHTFVCSQADICAPVGCAKRVHNNQIKSIFKAVL